VTTEGGVADPEIELNVQITEPAYVEFQFATAKYYGPVAVVFALALGVSAYVNAPILRTFDAISWMLLMTCGSLGLAILTFLIGPWLARRRFRRLYRANSYLSLPCHFTFSSEGVAVQNVNTNAQNRWGLFTELKVLKPGLYLKFGPSIGYFIPNDAFETPEVKMQVISLVRAHVGSSIR